MAVSPVVIRREWEEQKSGGSGAGLRLGNVIKREGGGIGGRLTPLQTP